MNQNPAATHPHLHNKNLCRLIMEKTDPQLCTEWLTHNDQLSLWMTYLSSLLTKNCCPILFGMGATQWLNYWVYFPLWEFLYLILKYVFSVFHLQQMDSFLFSLLISRGPQPFLSVHDYHEWDPYISGTSHYITVIIVTTLLAAEIPSGEGAVHSWTIPNLRFGWAPRSRQLSLISPNWWLAAMNWHSLFVLEWDLLFLIPLNIPGLFHFSNFLSPFLSLFSLLPIALLSIPLNMLITSFLQRNAVSNIQGQENIHII